MPADQLSLFDPKITAPATGSRRRPPLDPACKLEAAASTWLDQLRQADTSRHTLQAFKCDLNLLLQYAEPGLALNQVTTKLLNDFLNWMRHDRGVPCSDKTYGRRVTSLKAFFRWATPAAGLRADPAEAVLQLSVRSPLPDILSDEEVSRCLAAGEALRAAEKPDIRPLVIFSLLLETGMKKMEVANLRLEHLDVSNPDQPWLYVRYPNKKDWPKERKLSLTPGWVGLYRDYLAEHAPKRKAFPWSVRNLEYLLGDVGRAAGVDKSVSFDIMRWTCAVRDYRDGMEPEALRRKLGLSSIQWREIGRKVKQLAEGPTTPQDGPARRRPSKP